MSGATGTTTRRGNAKGVARREAIIDAATRLFSERGFRGTGIIGLAAEVGMSHVGLLHHFGTKEALLRAVVAQRDPQLSALIAGVAGTRGLEAIANLRGMGLQIASEPLLARLFSVLIAENLRADDPLHPYFCSRYRALRGYFENAVRTGQEDGTIRTDADPVAVGAEAVGFLLGVQTEHLLEPDAVDLVATFDSYTTRLLASLATEESGAGAGAGPAAAPGAVPTDRRAGPAAESEPGRGGAG